LKPTSTNLPSSKLAGYKDAKALPDQSDGIIGKLGVQRATLVRFHKPDPVDSRCFDTVIGICCASRRAANHADARVGDKFFSTLFAPHLRATSWTVDGAILKL
jgi:hypothetical protein